MSIRLALSEGTQAGKDTFKSIPKRFVFRKALLPIVVAVMVFATACGGNAVTPPQVDQPGYTVPATPDVTPTPTTPDVPQNGTPITPDKPENGANGTNGDNGYAEEPGAPDVPTEDTPVADAPTPVERNRHFQIRTTGNQGSPSGLSLTGRFGPMNAETKQTLVRELAEDANYTFADQLKGPDGAPVAQFTYHTAVDNNTNIGWITLDFKDGESILVASTDMNPNRPNNFSITLQGQGGRRFTPEQFGAFVAERAGN